MSIEEIKVRLNLLLSKYPDDLRILNSPEAVKKNKIDVLNGEVHGPLITMIRK